MTANLNPDKALIFRIVHLNNVPWILDHNGIYCRSSAQQDQNYINIGSAELIDKRSRRLVPVPPGGNLSDYVPFYFTPFSIMMYNIKTGYGGIKQRENHEIVMFVSSIPRLARLGVPYLFTNQHAYSIDTEFFSDIKDLNKIDWPLLESRNFKTDDLDPGKQLRYQAEALVHRHVPLEALSGIGCHNDTVRNDLEELVSARNLKIDVKTTATWYF